MTQVSVEVARRPNICYIFGMVMVQGPQRQCSRIQIYKYKDKYNYNYKICYIFGMVMVQGPQKQCSQVSENCIVCFQLVFFNSPTP